jgi:CRISPR/Cas system-associated exonuclease Cas4 (RecB family)
MNISYHAWKDYCECPQKYALRYRRNVPPTVPQNDYHKLYGVTIEKFFELFCNRWRMRTGGYMPPDYTEKKLRAVYDQVLETTEVNWSAPFAKLSSEDIFQEVLKDTHTIMDSQNQNYFLNTRSEVEFSLATKMGVNLTGRIDFIHEDPLTGDEYIYDGKGATKIGKNVDIDQVLFYALLYHFQYEKLPVGLGFFYYRFNTLVPVDISTDILNLFRIRLSQDIKTILDDTKFVATPCTKACKYCNYRNSCQDFISWQARRRKAPDTGIPEKEGLVEFGI